MSEPTWDDGCWVRDAIKYARSDGALSRRGDMIVYAVSGNFVALSTAATDALLQLCKE